MVMSEKDNGKIITGCFYCKTSIIKHRSQENAMCDDCMIGDIRQGED